MPSCELSRLVNKFGDTLKCPLKSIAQWLPVSVLVVLVGLLGYASYRARFEIHQQITHHFGGPRIGFFGDSNTAHAGVWDWQLGRFGFQTANYGIGGAGISIISWFARAQIIERNQIKIASIMVGTNEVPGVVLNHNGDVQAVLSEYEELIRYLEAHGVEKIVVSSAPPQESMGANRFIKELNAGVARYVATNPKCSYIDLWPLMSDGERVLPGMTFDGVHFTQKAYAIWAEQLKQQLFNDSHPPAEAEPRAR